MPRNEVLVLFAGMLLGTAAAAGELPNADVYNGATDHAAHHPPTILAVAQTAMIKGVVRSVDKRAGTVTIAHDPLTNLNMPAMTMTFAVTKPGWLDGLKEGSRVRFVAENVGGALTVVALEQVK